jgi:hypothetical protein
MIKSLLQREDELETPTTFLWIYKPEIKLRYGELSQTWNKAQGKVNNLKKDKVEYQ